MAYSSIGGYSIGELTSEGVPARQIVYSENISYTTATGHYTTTASSNQYWEPVIIDEPVENEREATEEITRIRYRILNDPFSLTPLEYETMLSRINNLEKYLEVESKKRERKNLLINKILQLCQNETKGL